MGVFSLEHCPAARKSGGAFSGRPLVRYFGAGRITCMVVRTYYGPGAKDLFDLLENRKAEVEAAIRSVPGLVS